MLSRTAVAWVVVGTAAIATAVGCTAAARDSAQEPGRVPPEVFDAARSTGAVRVIVQLMQDPQQSIASAQQAVLTELSGTAFRVLHQYANSPVLALEAGEDALRVLDRSPHVRSVAPDVILYPMAPGPRR